jgi:uncharacterized repeat protein (TIGR03803 family)
MRILPPVLLLLGGAAYGADTYEGAGVVQIPTLGIGSATYSDVSLTVSLPLLSGPSGSLPLETGDSYDPANNELFVPAISLGSTTYYNVAVSVGHLLSIGSVSGADTFDGTNLLVRNLQVGAGSYHDVTLHVGIANLAGVHGGLPVAPVDQYDAATGQLTVGAVQFGTKVYTNVILDVAPSDVVSVAGFTERVVYGFQGNADGSAPVAGLVMDANGNLYGTTSDVGASEVYGTVFRLTPDGSGGYTETVLHNFASGPNDGANPTAGLVLDAQGNLFGTTSSGGGASAGTVFELSPDGSGGYAEKVLYSFTDGTDGGLPSAGLILDAHGNLFGTTQFGGSAGLGTVFELTPAGGGLYTQSVLHSFPGVPDGEEPQSSLILDANGNLYGTTPLAGSAYAGTVYELSPNGGGGYAERILYNFSAGADGGGPGAGLVLDANGNLYGTASGGGKVNAGVVFRLAPNGTGGYTESVLYNFGTGVFEDGIHPSAGLILDAGGNLYGTAGAGGTDGRGTVFKLTPNGSGSYTESVLYNFQGSPDGNGPEASLVMDPSGNLYGTTTTGGPNRGGSSYGTVFEIH